MPFPITVEFNEFFFTKWSEEMAYVLGLYFTDGDLCKNYTKNDKSDPYYARLYSKDETFLENILIVMEGNPKIGHIKQSVFKKNPEDKGITRGALHFFHLGKRGMINDLYNLGMRKDKQEILFPTIPDKYKRHFIRGLFDGNGSYYIEGERYLRAQFGHVSFDLVSKVQHELEKEAGLTPLKIYENKGSIKVTHFLKYNRMEDLEKLFQYLYKNNENSLCRKQERYEFFYHNIYIIKYL